MKIKVTRKRAIELFCHQCMGYYSDGKVDCECSKCPLYTYMPYRKHEPDQDCFRINEKRCGKVLISDFEPTDKQRAAWGNLAKLSPFTREKQQGGEND